MLLEPRDWPRERVVVMAIWGHKFSSGRSWEVEGCEECPHSGEREESGLPEAVVYKKELLGKRV